MHSEECDAAQTHQLFHLRSYQKPSKESSIRVTKGAFQKFTVENGKAFSAREDNVASISKISINWDFPFLLTFLLDYPEFSDIRQFLEFPESSPGHFEPLNPVSNFVVVELLIEAPLPNFGH